MTESMVFEDAASALAEASAQDSAARAAEEAALSASPESDANSEQAPAASTSTNVEDGTTTAPSVDSGLPEWNLDINALPDEVKPFAKSIQSDYTKKAQALAEERKRYEQYGEFGEPDDVAQAVALARAFQSDPQGTLKQIQEGLRNMGLEVEDATPTPTTQETPEEDPLLAKLAAEYGKDDPLFKFAERMHSTLQTVESERNVFRKEREEAEQARLLRENEEYLARTEIAVRKANEDWDDEDIDYVYDIAPSTGGDLEKAAVIYDEIGTRFLTRYLATKGTQTQSTGAVQSTAAGQQPPAARKTLAEGHRDALAELQSLVAQGEFSLDLPES